MAHCCADHYLRGRIYLQKYFNIQRSCEKIKAEIISVGTELLLGEIVDTNAAFLSKELAALGIFVYHRVTVGDNLERLTSAFKDALKAADLVIATGGLGPTADDVTKEALAAVFGLEMILDEGLLDHIQSFFTSLGREMTENNRSQAYLPSGASAIENSNGTAPGVLLEKDGKTIILLPGPPVECESMFAEKIRPMLLKVQDSVLVSKTLKTIGLGESAMETLVKDMLGSENPTIAPYAGNSESWLRITAKAANEQAANALIGPVKEALAGRLKGYIYGEDNDSVESVVIGLLKEKNKTLALAESCTGGMVAARLTNVPGASDVFLESCVVYSNEAKIHRLNCLGETIQKHGAVSRETAEEMARGICRTSGANIGLSITGIAGPTGGTAEKPAGLVYIGCCVDGRCEVHERRWSGSREGVRRRAAAMGLEVLWRALQN